MPKLLASGELQFGRYFESLGKVDKIPRQWIFVIAGVSLLLITLATVSYQAARAASMDPVKSLRIE